MTVTPQLGLAAFTCPHCRAHAQQDWASAGFQDKDGYSVPGPSLQASTCYSCREHAVWLVEDSRPFSGPTTGRLIHPVTDVSAPAPNADLDPAVQELYAEAAAVANLSPRSASALLRVALESLLQSHYNSEQRLNDLIGRAAADGLPKAAQQAMDYVRFTGNASAHELHSDDTPQTVEVLFGLVNLAAQYLLSMPKQTADLFATLPPEKQDQVAKRDGHPTDG